MIEPGEGYKEYQTIDWKVIADKIGGVKMKVRAKVYEPSMEGVQTARIHTLEKGATVKGLLKKDGYAFDKHKEYIIDFDTGENIQLNLLVENKKTYVIIQKSDTERIIDLLEDILSQITDLNSKSSYDEPSDY